MAQKIQSSSHVDRASINPKTLTAEKLHPIFYEAVYKICLRSLRDPNEAEDVTSEVFLVAVPNLEKLREHPDPLAWMIRTTMNKCASHARRREPLAHRISPDHAAPPVSERKALDSEVRRVLAGLTIAEREPLILCDVEDMTAREAAVFLGITEEALKHRLYKSRKAFKAAIAA